MFLTCFFFFKLVSHNQSFPAHECIFAITVLQVKQRKTKQKTGYLHVLPYLCKIYTPLDINLHTK